MFFSSGQRRHPTEGQRNGNLTRKTASARMYLSTTTQGNLITPNGDNMWVWDLSQYVDKAYDQAVETLLWSESAGCMHPEDSECDGCDRSFMDLGYYNSETVYSQELRDALDGLIMLYWPALCTLNMHPDDFGHNFILSANGHGTGFWDRGYGKKIGKELTADCRPHEGISGYIDYDTGLVNITM